MRDKIKIIVISVLASAVTSIAVSALFEFVF